LSARVLLRDVEESDLDSLFEHQRDPESVRMAAVPARDRAAFDAHWARILADETTITKAIVVDGQVVGNVLSFMGDGRRLVGYWIDRHHWGKGIATAALARFLELVEIRPLYAHAAIANVGSTRVLERCGFVAIDERVDGEGENRVLERVYELR
jgi:RimJ/RimL family protein N-acetyltransferase